MNHIEPYEDALILMLEDAERWRALMSSERIRVMGGSGFKYDTFPPTPAAEHLHIGVEFWNKHPTANDPNYPQEHCRAWFKAYVDALVAARKARS